VQQVENFLPVNGGRCAQMFSLRPSRQFSAFSALKAFDPNSFCNS
jgi:hypothetical protein